MKGMTGFGSTQIKIEEYLFQISLTSLNHRFIEIHVKLPDGFELWEPRIRERIKEKFKRGKFFFSANVTYSEKEFMKKSLTELKKILKEVKQKTGKNLSLTLNDLFFYTRFVMSSDLPIKVEKMWKEFEKALEKVMEETDKMRISEGEKTFAEMKKSLEIIKAKAEEIYSMKDEIIKKKVEKIKEDVENLLNKTRIDETRLLTESAILAERHDFSEEISRLKSHLEFFEKTMQENEAGKKLNFITQEMLRETHTLSNKALDSKISRLCIEIKNELEKIKEHTQNVE